MTATAKTQLLIPPPEPKLPDCPLCWHECTLEDTSLVCLSCRLGWPDDWGRPGYRLDEHLPVCGETDAPWPDHPDLHVYRYGCVLNKDHDSYHRGTRTDRRADSGAHTWPQREPESQS
jgi:hypothetical protein